MLGRRDEAEAHFTEALNIYPRLRAPFFIAETELVRGLLLAGNDLGRPIPLIVDAAQLATRHGCTWSERLARQALLNQT